MLPLNQALLAYELVGGTYHSLYNRSNTFFTVLYVFLGSSSSKAGKKYQVQFKTKSGT